MRNWKFEYHEAAQVARRDATYDDEFEVWLDREEGHFIWLERLMEVNGDTVYGSVWQNRDREKIRCDADRYLKIPALTHATHHEFFQDFLKERQPPGNYFGSIGGYFAELGKTHDRQTANAVKYAWREFRDKRCVEWLFKFIEEETGIKVRD